MLWHQNKMDTKLIQDASDRIICYCDNWVVAMAIVQNHNASLPKPYAVDDTVWTAEQIEAMHAEKLNVKY